MFIFTPNQTSKLVRMNQSRVIIENVRPQLEGGAHAIKSIVGEYIPVTATVVGDGHDVIAASLRYKHQSEKKWSETRMQATGNDQWAAGFATDKQGAYQYKIEAWVDHALNWQHGIERKIDDKQHVNSELLEGAEYLTEVAKQANASEKKYLTNSLQPSKMLDNMKKQFKRPFLKSFTNCFLNIHSRVW